MTRWQKTNTQLAILYILYRTPLLRQGETAPKGQEKNGHSKNNRIAIITICHTTHTTVCNSVFHFLVAKDANKIVANEHLVTAFARPLAESNRTPRALVVVQNIFKTYTYIYIYRLFSGVYIYIFLYILRARILPNDLGVQSVGPVIFF